MISVIYERSVAKLDLTPDTGSLFMITFFSPLYFLQELNYTTCEKTVCDMKHSFFEKLLFFVLILPEINIIT